MWTRLFQATWRGFLSKIKLIMDKMRWHRQLIESRAIIMTFESMQGLRERRRPQVRLA